MTPKGDAMDHSKVLISEIETNLESELQKQREKIERELEERLQREREDSERKLTLIEEEFRKEQGTLRDYKNAVVEYEAARESLENQMREHLDMADRHQGEIERLTTLTREEINRILELSARLADLRDSTESRVGELKIRLQEKFGVGSKSADGTPPGSAAETVPAAAAAPAAEPERSASLDFLEKETEKAREPRPESGEVVVDLEQELGKLKRIKEMLEKDTAGFPDSTGRTTVQANAVAQPMEPLSEPETPPEPEPPEWSGIPKPDSVPARSEFKMPEINQFIQDFVKREHGLAGPTDAAPAAPTKAEEKRPAMEEANFQSVFEILEKYRRSEATDYNGEISFFQNGDHLILDGESLLRAVGHIVDEARKLCQRLGQAGTPKEQFFIKQELINNQEILRKIVLRSVRMCERESCRLPSFTSDIVNAGILKDILERLNMDNWSNQEDFSAFETMSNKMKNDFYRRITPPAQYLRSIVQELEG
jgi:hypothetical protein